MKILINIDVADRARAEKFYLAAFELTVGRRFGDGGVELVGANAPIYLLQKARGTAPFRGASETRRYDRHWTPVHLDFAVKDLGAAHLRAVSAGAVAEGEIENHAWGRIAYFCDPFGNGFCLVQFSQHGYDAIAS